VTDPACIDPTLAPDRRRGPPVERCDAGPRPRRTVRVRLALNMWRYATLRAACGDFGALVCYVVPSYSGGDSMAAVDGALRLPQCFGARGEPWAQPDRGAHCIAEFDLEPVVEVRLPAGGYCLRLGVA
jgi:hypothetical protein